MQQCDFLKKAWKTRRKTEKEGNDEKVLTVEKKKQTKDEKKKNL